MNIKGVLGPQIPNPVKNVEKVDRAIHSDMSHDRDANGQQTFGDQKKDQGPMSDEQLEKAMEQLRQLPALKEHHWTVQLAIEDGKKFVLVKDNLGTLIRRIPEADLWSLSNDGNSTKGHLFKRAA